ncbi:MAG: peptide/nickel transport system permease protein [Gammaproteobacteria bacterium]
MLRYTARRLFLMCITVIGMVTVVFFLLRAIPGDPASYMLGDYATEESVAALKAELGLDRPVWEQYLTFVKRALTGDMGTSVVTGQPAFDEVVASIPWSAALAFSGILIAVTVGVPMGVMSAVRQGTFTDLFIMLGALIGISFPVFWVGLVCILLFAHEIRLFPALGASSSQDILTQWHHLMLPALVLGFSVAAYIARLTRSAMLEVLGQDFVRVARAMGIPERRIVYRLALRNALIPVLAVIGVTFAWSLGSAILVEAVFSRPGLGSMILKAVFARDYQLVQAGVFVLATAVVLVNTTLDIVYGLVDPRVSVS